jgi:hypothetical protein
MFLVRSTFRNGPSTSHGDARMSLAALSRAYSYLTSHVSGVYFHLGHPHLQAWHPIHTKRHK